MTAKQSRIVTTSRMIVATQEPDGARKRSRDQKRNAHTDGDAQVRDHGPDSEERRQGQAQADQSARRHLVQDQRTEGAMAQARR